MLRINRQTDYAVRVVLALAIRDGNPRISSASIQEEMRIPPSFMSRIVAKLANFGIIKTYPGRDGGITLARSSEQITLKDIVEAFEGPILLSECLQVKSEDDCPFQNNCMVRSKWGRVQVAMLREMASINFADLTQEAVSSKFDTSQTNLNYSLALSVF